MKNFGCPGCGNPVHFDNSRCLQCGIEFAFEPATQQMVGLTDTGFLACAMRTAPDGCNWALPADPSPMPGSLCLSCQLTRADADTSVANAPLRARAEAAKRRLLYTLLALHIPFGPKQGSDDVYGLSFCWLAPGGADRRVTGHADGLITLDLAEADDAHREFTRVQFGEPQRTILGHLRHEVSHHLHQRFVTGTTFESGFRERFGDERADYAQALERHYTQGPPVDWTARHISAYASSHPWEDWAETCAHYLLMVDAVGTAVAWGLQLQAPQAVGNKPVTPHEPASATLVPSLALDQWLPMAQFMNAMARSIGVADSYPYLIADPIVEKLRFVQEVLASARGT